jgi:hypothetical protein
MEITTDRAPVHPRPVNEIAPCARHDFSTTPTTMWQRITAGSQHSYGRRSSGSAPPSPNSRIAAQSQPSAPKSDASTLDAPLEILRAPEREPWGSLEMWIADPDGVRIVLAGPAEGDLAAIEAGVPAGAVSGDRYDATQMSILDSEK